jgi:hypothetical protein
MNVGLGKAVCVQQCTSVKQPNKIVRNRKRLQDEPDFLLFVFIFGIVPIEPLLVELKRKKIFEKAGIRKKQHVSHLKLRRAQK